MTSGFARTLSILIAMALGALVPQAHAFSWAIRWTIVVMLFLVFLQTRLSRTGLQRSHLTLLAVNIGLGYFGWGVGWLAGGRDLALVGFFAGITPTAIAAPVIISFLRGRVDYVVMAFLLSNVAIPVLLPVLLPLVLGRTTPDVMVQVLGSMVFVVFAPMLGAWLLRALHPAAAEWPSRLRNFSFALWVTTMFLVTANASEFLRQHADTPHLLLAKIALLTLLMAAVNFGVGRLIGGPKFGREASQALGQKNTTFAIYLALSYASPLVALGPTCYVLWHNLWNSWQLHQGSRRESGD